MSASLSPPVSTPAGVATIRPSGAARGPGRWVEAGLLGVALAIGLGGFLLTALNRTGSSPAQIAKLGGALAVIAIVVHLWVRFTAPWADPVLLPTAVALNGIGLAMIQRLDQAYLSKDQPEFYVGSKQLVWTVLGVIMFCLVLALRDHRRLRRWDRWAMWTGLAFLLLPFVPFIGREVNGARIWIILGPLSFQPAELSKVLLAVFFASFLVANRDNLALAGRRVLWMNLPRARHLGPLLVVWGVSIMVLVLQRDLGSSVLLFGLFVVVLYVATDRPSWLIIGALLFLPAAWFAATHLSHVQQRINGWLHAMDPEVYDGIGGSWQLVTGMFGMASGGLMGSGWGEGYPDMVTFANSDFIIASLGEELGLTGTLAILLLYLVLVQRGLRTAMALRDGFGKLLATGLSFTIALQVFVVVGGVTRLIPLTGLTTPFLAYGGSSLISNWIILALLLRLSDAARRPATQAPQIIDTAELPSSLRNQVQHSQEGNGLEADLGDDIADDAVPHPGPQPLGAPHEAQEAYEGYEAYAAGPVDGGAPEDWRPVDREAETTSMTAAGMLSEPVAGVPAEPWQQTPSSQAPQPAPVTEALQPTPLTGTPQPARPQGWKPTGYGYPEAYPPPPPTPVRGTRQAPARGTRQTPPREADADGQEST